jgi:hypothetical protein
MVRRVSDNGMTGMCDSSLKPPSVSHFGARLFPQRLLTILTGFWVIEITARMPKCSSGLRRGKAIAPVTLSRNVSERCIHTVWSLTKWFVIHPPIFTTQQVLDVALATA